MSNKFEIFEKKWDGFGMVWGWFGEGLGIFSDRFRRKIKIENLELKK